MVGPANVKIAAEAEKLKAEIDSKTLKEQAMASDAYLVRLGHTIFDAVARAAGLDLNPLKRQMSKNWQRRLDDKNRGASGSR